MPADAFSGWPELTYTYGTTGQTSELQTETFDFDLTTMEICLDTDSPPNISNDFEGFTFTEADGSFVTVSPLCSPYVAYDLS